MPVYTQDEPRTLNLRDGDPAGIVVSYTFDPGIDCPHGCPRVSSPATTEPPELYPGEVLGNLDTVKKWLRKCELSSNYHPKKLRETWLTGEIHIEQSGAVVMEYVVGRRDETDPGAIGPSPPALHLKRTWNPGDNMILTDARGEFNISYPAFQQFIEIQEHFLQIIGQMSLE